MGACLSAWGTSWGRSWGSSWGGIGSEYVGGGGDNSSKQKPRRRNIFKPSGDTGRRVKNAKQEIKKELPLEDKRPSEIDLAVQNEFSQENRRFADGLEIQNRLDALWAMEQKARDAEIAILLHKKLRTEEDELLLLLAMAAAVV